MRNLDHNKFSWETYNECVYFFIDYSGMTDLDVFNLSLISRKTIKEANLDSIRVLVDMRDMDISFSTLATLTQFSNENRSFISKVAIINNLEKTEFFQQLYEQNSRVNEITFSTKEEALAFLCAD